MKIDHIKIEYTGVSLYTEVEANGEVYRSEAHLPDQSVCDVSGAIGLAISQQLQQNLEAARQKLETTS